MSRLLSARGRISTSSWNTPRPVTTLRTPHRDGSVPSRTDGGASGNGDDATVDVLAQRRSSGDGLSDVQSRRSQSEQISTLAENSVTLIASKQQEILERVKATDVRLTHMETVINRSFRELKVLIETQEKKSYTIRNSPYEVELKHKIANLFCETLNSYPQENQVNDVVKDTLSRDDFTKKYKVVVAIKAAKDMLSTFRTEERRKILGIPPYPNACLQDTVSLCRNLIDFLKASTEKVEPNYLRHLVLMRKYVRENQACAQQRFHEGFKTWLSDVYENGVEESEWETLFEEDEHHPYNEYPISYPGITVTQEGTPAQ